LGASDSEKLKIGFGDQDNSAAVEKEIKKFLSPEFRNRIDAIVKFNKLGAIEMNLIVNSEVDQTEKLLAGKNITINVTQQARDYLAIEGYDPKMGARPFRRLFEKLIKQPLSNEILFGKLKDGGRVNVDMVEGVLVVSVLEAIVVEPVVIETSQDVAQE
jgi:ATP-dependent Clp protease ATP-binding subunit ClpA